FILQSIACDKGGGRGGRKEEENKPCKPDLPHEIISSLTLIFLSLTRTSKYFLSIFLAEMSSLLREEMDRVLFRPEGQTLAEFIEIEEQQQGRHFLCVSITKEKEVQISVIHCKRNKPSGSKKLQHSGLEDSYERTEIWALTDLLVLDGRDPDKDDPCFLMHFNSVRFIKAVSCAAKYTLARCLLSLSKKHNHTNLKLTNFDWTYIQPTGMYSDRGDCVVLAQVCFYAFNLVCLSLCPVPLE
ncbi:hypothetical protein DNTS_006731, partial [Danionella cerebrum]